MAKFEIRNRFTNSIMFSIEAESFIKAVEQKVREKANLSGTDLSGTNLSYSNLSYSNLSYSNLSHSNLSYSNLSHSNLSHSGLRGTDLRGTNLRYSNLSGTNLSGTDLRYSDLSGANLFSTCCDPQKEPNGDTSSFLERDGEWIVGYRTRATSAAGGFLVDDRIYGCEVFSVAETKCHPGWYLCPTYKSAKAWKNEEIIKVRTRAKDIHKPAEGNAWRTRMIWVIGTVIKGG